MNKRRRKGNRTRHFKQPPGKVFRNGRWVTFNEAARMEGFKNTYARQLRAMREKSTDE